MRSRRWLIVALIIAVLLVVWAPFSSAYGSSVYSLADALRRLMGMSGPWRAPGSLATRLVPILAAVIVFAPTPTRGAGIAALAVMTLFVGETTLSLLSEPLYHFLGEQLSLDVVAVMATVVRYGVPFGFLVGSMEYSPVSAEA